MGRKNGVCCLMIVISKDDCYVLYLLQNTTVHVAIDLTTPDKIKEWFHGRSLGQLDRSLILQYRLSAKTASRKPSESPYFRVTAVRPRQVSGIK